MLKIVRLWQHPSLPSSHPRPLSRPTPASSQDVSYHDWCLVGQNKNQYFTTHKPQNILQDELYCFVTLLQFEFKRFLAAQLRAHVGQLIYLGLIFETVHIFLPRSDKTIAFVFVLNLIQFVTDGPMLLPFALFRAWTAESWLPSSSRHWLLLCCRSTNGNIKLRPLFSWRG